MSQLLILNPRKRRAGAKRRRPMTAKQRMYFGKRRKSPARKPRVIVRRRSRRVVTVMANPRRRRRAAVMSRRRMRRNPVSARRMSFSLGSLKTTFMDAGTGAVGAVLVDVAMGQIAPRLPVNMVTPTIYPFIKGGVAVLLGVLGSRVLGQHAAKMATGSLTCTMHEVMRSYVAGVAPLGYINSGRVVRGGPRQLSGMGQRHLSGGVGAFLSGKQPGSMSRSPSLMGLGQNTPMEREMTDYGPAYTGMGAFLSR